MHPLRTAVAVLVFTVGLTAALAAWASDAAPAGHAPPAEKPPEKPAAPPAAAPGATAPVASAVAPDSELYPVPPPPFSPGVFPCMDCHSNLDVNTTVRPLEEHTDIKFQHGERDRWCFDCHNPENRDMLRLASGRLVPFSESYRLCGQCHGDKLRDWKVGVHGKRTGSWSGKKQYLLCAHCHNPHSPRFKPLKPEPPPRAPRNPHVGERHE